MFTNSYQTYRQQVFLLSKCRLNQKDSKYSLLTGHSFFIFCYKDWSNTSLSFQPLHYRNMLTHWHSQEQKPCESSSVKSWKNTWEAWTISPILCWCCSCPQHPPFPPVLLYAVSSLKVAQIQVLNPLSAPLCDLSTLYVPRPHSFCLSLNLFCRVPFISPVPAPLPHLFSALYTLDCWHVLCVSSLWRLFRHLIKDRSSPQQKLSALPLNKQFISLFFFSLPPCPSPLHPCVVFFTFGKRGHLCTC